MASQPLPTLSNPTPESLLLSASQFTNTIDSWIPTTFAPPKSESQLDKEFQKALETASRDGEHERLGLGHPGLDVPRLGGFGGLSKRLGGIKGKGKGKTQDDEEEGRAGRIGGDANGDEEEEDESRVKSVGKGKKRNNTFDPLAPKKKVKIKPPIMTRPQGIASTPDTLRSDSKELFKVRVEAPEGSSSQTTRPFYSSFDTSSLKTTQLPNHDPSPSNVSPPNVSNTSAKKPPISTSSTSYPTNILLLDPDDTARSTDDTDIDDTAVAVPVNAGQGGDKPSRTQRRREARRLAKLRGGDKGSQSGNQQ